MVFKHLQHAVDVHFEPVAGIHSSWGQLLDSVAYRISVSWKVATLSHSAPLCNFSEDVDAGLCVTSAREARVLLSSLAEA